MKGLLITGLLLVVLGAGAMIVGSIPVEDEHSAEVFGSEISVTETEHRRIPLALSGTLLGLGAALSVIAAVKMKGSQA